MNWLNIEKIIEQIINHLITHYPEAFGIGAYILALISVSTIALLCVLVIASIWFPWELAKKILVNLKNFRGDKCSQD